MTLLLYLCVVVFCFAVMKCSCCSVVHGMVCHGIVLCSKYVMVLHCTTSFFSHCMCADYFSLIYCTIDDYSTLCLLYCSTTYNIASYYVILVFTGIFFWGVQNDVSHVATWLTRKKKTRVLTDVQKFGQRNHVDLSALMFAIFRNCD